MQQILLLPVPSSHFTKKKQSDLKYCSYSIVILDLQSYKYLHKYELTVLASWNVSFNMQCKIPMYQMTWHE